VFSNSSALKGRSLRRAQGLIGLGPARSTGPEPQHNGCAGDGPTWRRLVVKEASPDESCSVMQVPDIALHAAKRAAVSLPQNRSNGERGQNSNNAERAISSMSETARCSDVFTENTSAVSTRIDPSEPRGSACWSVLHARAELTRLTRLTR
jgi:hypothetical protein